MASSRVALVALLVLLFLGYGFAVFRVSEGVVSNSHFPTIFPTRSSSPRGYYYVVIRVYCYSDGTCRLLRIRFVHRLSRQSVVNYTTSGCNWVLVEVYVGNRRAVVQYFSCRRGLTETYTPVTHLYGQEIYVIASLYSPDNRLLQKREASFTIR